MKKMFFAAALAALAAGHAAAQSQVTIYGRLNTSIERTKDAAGNHTDMLNNASRLGVRGTEDLGGGLNAGFVLEHGFASDTGAPSGAMWGRQSEVFLGGSWGTLRLGNFTSEAYFATADYVSMHNHDTGTSSDAFYADTRYFGQTDKIGYTLPAFGGLVLHVAVNARDLPTDVDRTTEIAANYDMGPWHFGAGWQKTGDRDQFALRALGEFGPFTLGGYVQRDQDVYGPGHRTTLRLAGVYTVGVSEFHLNVGRAGDYSGLDDSAATQLTLAYNYNLSKRTKLYAFYSKVADGDAEVYGGDRRHLAVGVRHNF